MWSQVAAPAPPEDFRGRAGAPQEHPAPPTGDMMSQVSCFNRILKKLTGELVTRYPSDPLVNRAKKRIMLGIDVNPVGMIKIAGPYLYKYREQIYSNDSAFFVENEYDEDLKHTSEQGLTDLVSYIIPRVKDAWRESGEDDKATLTAAVVELMDTYLEYLALKMSA